MILSILISPDIEIIYRLLLPFSVAELASVTRTLTKSPIRCVPLSNTTTRFCSVRPNNWSRERLETPSTKHFIRLFPMQRWLDSADRRFCKAIISFRRRTFTSSGTLSSRCFDAYVPGRSEYLNIKRHHSHISISESESSWWSLPFLRMETGEDIGSQSAIGNDTFDSGYPVQIPLTGIFTVHQFQDAGTAALAGGGYTFYMHIRHLAIHFQSFIAHILRMGKSWNGCARPSGFGHHTEQHREGNHFAVGFSKR